MCLRCATGKLRHEGIADGNAALQQGVGDTGRAPRTHHAGRCGLPDLMWWAMAAKPTQELGPGSAPNLPACSLLFGLHLLEALDLALRANAASIDLHPSLTSQHQVPHPTKAAISLSFSLLHCAGQAAHSVSATA